MCMYVSLSKFVCTLCMEEPPRRQLKEELGSQAIVSHNMDVRNSVCIFCRKVWNLNC